MSDDADRSPALSSEPLASLCSSARTTFTDTVSHHVLSISTASAGKGMIIECWVHELSQSKHISSISAVVTLFKSKTWV